MATKRQSKRQLVTIVLLAAAGTMPTVASAAVVYQAIDLGTLGGVNSNAAGINNSGLVIGGSGLGAGPHNDLRPFRWGEKQGYFIKRE